MPLIIQSSVSIWAQIKDEPKTVFQMQWRQEMNAANAQIMSALFSIMLQGSFIFIFMWVRERTQWNLISQAAILNIVPSPGTVELSIYCSGSGMFAHHSMSVCTCDFDQSRPFLWACSDVHRGSTEWF